VPRTWYWIFFFSSSPHARETPEYSAFWPTNLVLVVLVGTGHTPVQHVGDVHVTLRQWLRPGARFHRELSDERTVWWWFQPSLVHSALLSYQRGWRRRRVAPPFTQLLTRKASTLWTVGNSNFVVKMTSKRANYLKISFVSL
jgi:hypothetical protein